MFKKIVALANGGWPITSITDHRNDRYLAVVEMVLDKDSCVSI